MKNLKKLFGLFGIAGCTFAFTGAVNAQSTMSAVTNDIVSCLNNSTDDSSTCTLKGDLTGDKAYANQITISKNVTLNLGSYTFEIGGAIKVTDGATLTIKGNDGELKGISTNNARVIRVNGGATLNTTGKVKITSTAATTAEDVKSVIAVYGSNNDTKKTTVTIGSDTTVTSARAGIIVYPYNYNGSSSSANANGVVLNLNGEWNTKDYVVQVNGKVSKDNNAPVVNINGGFFESTGNTAIYASGYATWNIKKGSISGAEGIEVVSGKVTIDKDVQVVANGPATSSTGHATNKGFAIGVVGHSSGSYPTMTDTELTINGGYFKSESANALYFKGANNATIKVNDGTYVSSKDVEVIQRDDGQPGNFVYGGTFEGQTTAISNGSALSQGLQSKTVGDVTYVGTPHDITLNGIDLENQTIENGTIDELHIPASAVAGQPINIADIIKVTANEGYVVKYVVTTADGKTVTVNDNEFTMPDSDVTITISIVKPGEEPAVKPDATVKPTDTNTDKKPATDNTASKNPQTYDAGIMGSLVLVLSSVGTLGYASKKVLSK